MRANTPITSDVGFFAFLLTYGDFSVLPDAPKWEMFIANGLNNNYCVGNLNGEMVRRVVHTIISDLAAINMLESYAERARKRTEMWLLDL